MNILTISQACGQSLIYPSALHVWIFIGGTKWRIEQ